MFSPGLTIEEVYDSFLNVYTLDWGQSEWKPANTGLSPEDDPVFVAMAHNDISIAYVAGQQNNDFEYPALYKTIDGGAHWRLSLMVTNNQNVFTGWEGNHGDSDWGYGGGALGLAVHPLDSAQAAFTDLGFIHLTTNGGAWWQQAYVNPADQNPTNLPTPRGRSYHSVGLEPTSCWGLAWADSNHLVAAYTDIKEAISSDAGASWSFGYSGDSDNTMYSCIKNPASGILYAGVSTVHDMYQSTHLTDASISGAGGAVLSSTNQGVTWQTMTNFAAPVVWVELDPVNTNRLFASVVSTDTNKAGIYVSNNAQTGAGAGWRRLAAPPRTQGHPLDVQALNDGSLVCTYSGRRGGNPQAFTASSGVFFSSNGGASWIDRSDPGMHYWTMDLVIDPSDPAQNTWYVGVFSGWGGPPNGLGGLYRTSNRGQSWNRLSNDGGGGVTSCAFNPLNTNELYVTTETEGLLFSDNIRSASPTFAAVANYPFAQPERVFFNPYHPAEIWVTSFGNGLRVGNTAAAAGFLQITPVSGSGAFQLNLEQGSPGAGYAILGSTNLIDWSVLATNAADAHGGLQFIDPGPADAHKFYKTHAL